MTKNPDTLLGVPIVWTSELPDIKPDEIILVDLPTEIRIRTGVSLLELLDLLVYLKIDHYRDGRDGLNDCDTYFGRECTCEADEHNDKIGAMISRLTEIVKQ